MAGSMRDAVLAEIRSDPSQYLQAMKQMEGANQALAISGVKAADDVTRAQANQEQQIRQTSAGYRSFAAAASSAAGQLAALTGSGDKTVFALQAINFQASTMADGLSRVGGRVGILATSFLSFGPIIAGVGAAATLAVVGFSKMFDALDVMPGAVAEAKNSIESMAGAIERLREDSEKARITSDATVRLHEQEAGAMKRISGLMHERAALLRVNLKEESARTVAQNLSVFMTEQDSEALERWSRIASYGTDTISALTAAVTAYREELKKAKLAQDEKAKALRAAAAGERAAAAAGERAAAAEEPKETEFDVAMRASAMAMAEFTTEYDRFATLRKTEREEREGVARELNELILVQGEAFEYEQNLAMQIEADALRATIATTSLTIGIISLGQAISGVLGGALNMVLGPSVKFIYANKEMAKAAKAMELSGGAAYQAMARDVIKALAVQASVQAIMETALGFAALARSFWDPSAAKEAPQHFAAAAAFALVGGAAIAATAAIPAVRRTIPDTGRGGGGGGGGGYGGEGLYGGTGGRQGGDTINLYVTVEPGASPEDVGRTVVRSLEAYGRDQNRRVRIFDEAA